jgi:hypothetical protein
MEGLRKDGVEAGKARRDVVNYLHYLNYGPGLISLKGIADNAEQ